MEQLHILRETGLLGINCNTCHLVPVNNSTFAFMPLEVLNLPCEFSIAFCLRISEIVFPFFSLHLSYYFFLHILCVL